ncbi:hypothetical protein LLG10_06415 [bacterium]|nr:hypothetical protein [bacterium]
MKNAKRSFWWTVYALSLFLILLSNLFILVTFHYYANRLHYCSLQTWQYIQKNVLQQSLNWMEEFFTLPLPEAEERITHWIETGKTDMTGTFSLFRDDILVFDSNEHHHVLFHGLPIDHFYPSIKAIPDERWEAFVEGIHSEPDGSQVLQWLPVKEEILLSWTSFDIQETTYHLVFSTEVEKVYDWNYIGEISHWRNLFLIFGNILLLLWIILMTWVFEKQEKKRIQTKREIENHQSLIRQYQQELKTVQKELFTLSQNTSAKDEFLMNMSHELRSPLNTILGMTDALKESADAPNPSEQEEKLSIIHESGLHLLSVFNDILDLAKVDAGKMVLEMTTFSIKGLCESCIRIIQPITSKKNIPIRLTIDPAVKGMTADETRIRQVLLNLLNNAVKFGITGKPIQFDVVPHYRQNAVSLIIRNEGDVIPYEKTSEIFQPFIQLDNTYSRRFQGTGLGLVLALKLVMAHHGSITLTSQGNITTFQVTLPLSPLPPFQPESIQEPILFYTENHFYEEFLQNQDIQNLFLTRQIATLKESRLDAYTHIFIELPFLLEKNLQLISEISAKLDKTRQQLVVILSLWHPLWEEELKQAGCRVFLLHPFNFNDFLDSVSTVKKE